MSKVLGKTNFDVGVADPVARIQGFINIYTDNKEYAGFEAALMRNIKIISAEKLSNSKDGGNARAVFELKAVPSLCNPVGTMHGGAVATAIDMGTTMSTGPAAENNYWEFGGVTRTLNISILRPIPVDSTVIIDCIVRSMGKRLSTIQCVIRDKVSGKVLATGEHGKAAMANQERNVDSKI